MHGKVGLAVACDVRRRHEHGSSAVERTFRDSGENRFARSLPDDAGLRDIDGEQPQFHRYIFPRSCAVRSIASFALATISSTSASRHDERRRKHHRIADRPHDEAALEAVVAAMRADVRSRSRRSCARPCRARVRWPRAARRRALRRQADAPRRFRAGGAADRARSCASRDGRAPRFSITSRFLSATALATGWPE
jgi:hypothetical protein